MGLSHEIFRPVFWPVWIYLGLNRNRFWFLNFKEGSLILCSYFKYWCVSCQTFSEIRRISEKDWQLSSRFSNFSLFRVSGPPRNAAKSVNHYRRFYESPRMIDNLFRCSPRMFFNNISVSFFLTQQYRLFSNCSAFYKYIWLFKLTILLFGMIQVYVLWSGKKLIFDKFRHVRESPLFATVTAGAGPGR